MGACGRAVAHADLMPTPTSGIRGSFRKHQGQGWVCTNCPATRRGQPFFLNLKAALNHERTIHNGATVEMRNADHENGVGIRETTLEAVDDACRDKIGYPPLTSEGLRQWEMHAHVDHVHDLVPFWQRGIDAAEKGEVLRLEEFLDKMEGDGGWRTAHQVLEMLGVCDSKSSQSERARGGWGMPIGWGAGSAGGWATRVASDATEASQERDGRKEWVRSELKMSRADAAVRECGGLLQQAKPARAVQGNNEELRLFVDAIARQEAVNEERRKQLYLFFEMTMEEKVQKIQETIRFLHAHGY